MQGCFSLSSGIAVFYQGSSEGETKKRDFEFGRVVPQAVELRHLNSVNPSKSTPASQRRVGALPPVVAGKGQEGGGGEIRPAVNGKRGS